MFLHHLRSSLMLFTLEDILLLQAQCEQTPRWEKKTAAPNSTTVRVTPWFNPDIFLTVRALRKGEITPPSKAVPPCPAPLPKHSDCLWWRSSMSGGSVMHPAQMKSDSLMGLALLLHLVFLYTWRGGEKKNKKQNKNKKQLKAQVMERRNCCSDTPTLFALLCKSGRLRNDLLCKTQGWRGKKTKN